MGFLEWRFGSRLVKLGRDYYQWCRLTNMDKGLILLAARASLTRVDERNCGSEGRRVVCITTSVISDGASQSPSSLATSSLSGLIFTSSL